MGTPWWEWGIFGLVVMALLVIDLGIFHKRDHAMSVKESLWLSAFYIAMGLLFGLWVWYSLGLSKMNEYYTGFLVEKSLSLDNLFVFSLIFSYFAVPRIYQHRVLFWGIIGVLVLRGAMIFLGATLVARFDWMLYVFGGFLVFIGIKMLVVKEEKREIADNPVLKFLKKHCRITPGFHGHQFFVRAPHPDYPKKKVLWFTPLLIVLILIDIADIIFAVDSIPAIFAITVDPFIVFTSNIFAVLGLRALYFALDAIMARFIYLNYALGLILVFIGSKVFVADLLHLEKIPPVISLSVTLLLLAGGIGLSLLKTKKHALLKSK